ncbi:hypothetical protein FP435_04380 [Lactobacillus sp. PV037]|uniref:hypothetical protein n=1 Tax=unclassified Lactobacillus TaxID=2620435 RepID=UPI00223FE229|nr:MULTISPECIES: hypothetical protein [unclassified Lactobacillus]QNQ82158.1 hypothetical protein FP433_03460 [Lactobacillus sp. PV012]QNQ83732.1 hypothetical protein FP435_04380 [Lactobacillus sp. PV037]
MKNSDAQKMVNRLEFLSTSFNLVIGCGMIYYGTNQEINTFARICLLIIAIIIIFLNHYTSTWKKEIQEKYDIPDEVDEKYLESPPVLIASLIFFIFVIAVLIFFVLHLHFNLWFILGLIYTIITLMTIFLDLLIQIIENK